MLNAINKLFSSSEPDPGDVPYVEVPGSFNVDEYRPMRVAVIGAGASGICAAIRFRQYIPNLELVVYEQMDGVGGTWYANTYPGVACDVASHAYQFSFEQKHDWSSMFSPGAEIHAYFEGIVDKYQLRQYIKLRHELVGARYDEATGKWHLGIRRPSKTSADGFEEIDDSVDFVFNGIGVLHRWKWPDIEGLDDFKGVKVHSAGWNVSEEEVESWKDKSVAVIGLGSSALQIVAALGPKAGRLYNVTRSKAWVALPSVVGVYKAHLGHEIDPTNPDTFKLTEEELKHLEDPEKLMAFRKDIEHAMNSLHTLTYPDSPLQKGAQQVTREYMQKALEVKPGYAEALIPDFSLCCRRLTPTPGYINALRRDNVELVRSEIIRVSTHGLELADGRHLATDVLVCATGFDTSYQLPFPIIGRGGVALSTRWTPHPETYLSLCVDGFPNMFFSNGPNSATGTNSVLLMMEHQIMYAVRAARKLQRERLKSIEPKPEAVTDFVNYAKNYFKKTVFVEPVKSWYKPSGPEGPVVGIWPGSAPHLYRTMRSPRWEDFNYERLDNTNNGLYWLGDGITHAETVENEDRSWYLNADYLDIPPIPPIPARAEPGEE